MLAAPLPSRSPSPPYSAFLSDAEMRKAVAGPLRSKGIRGPSLEDAIQSVLHELSRVRVQPTTRGGWLALARHVATQRAIDYVRKRARSQPVDAGLTDLADEHPSAEHDERRRDPVDAGKQLGLLQRQVESGHISQRQLTILEGVADGLDQAQIARELRLSHQTVRNELAIARKTYRSAWAQMAAGSVAVLVAGLFLYSVFREPEKVAAPPPPPTAEPRPETTSPQERAAGIRHDALHDCDLGRWEACLRGLDEARQLDPAGEQDLPVRKARTEAAKALGLPPPQNP